MDYQATSKELVHHLKVIGSTTVASFLARRMFEALVDQKLVTTVANKVGDSHPGISTDALVYLVPVPSRPEMTKIRGFVPSVLLAKKLARELSAAGVATRVGAVAKLSRSVQDQAALNRQGRWDNLNGAMTAFEPVAIQARRAQVWMVDDVVTTGASLVELQRCLTVAGWNVQRFVTFAETL